MSLGAGSKLGPYEILAPLGAGGMGEVYRARDSRLGRDVAVKVLPESTAKDPEALARFEREAKAVAALSHPNILALHDVGNENGVAYAVMELLDGKTLRERLSGGALPARKVVEYARQIAEGLAAAHDKGIVHRDLKPENLFITGDGRVKILDFGLAKQAAAASEPWSENTPTGSLVTGPGLVLGTVGYMSPEQVLGQPADHRSDIFAFGAVLYEMISGTRAFKGSSAIATLNAILKEEPAELSPSAAAAPALDRIIRHCLEKNAAERFQSARDLAFDLASFSGTTGGSAPIAAAAGRTKRWHLALATIAAVALLAGAFWLGRGLSPRGGAETELTDQQLTFQRGNILSARFTPDGESVIYSAGWNGQPPELYTARLDGSSSRPLGLKAADILSISAKGELAVKLHSSLSARPYMLGTLARLPISGGTPREVLENVLNADWDPAGNELAVVVIGGGGKARIEYPPGKLLYESSKVLWGLRFSPGGDQLAFVEEEPGRMNLRRLVIAAGTSRPAETIASSFVISGMVWAPGGQELWFSETVPGRPSTVRAVDLGGRSRPLLANLANSTLHDLSRNGRALVESYHVRLEMMVAAAGEPERLRSWLDGSIPVAIRDAGQTLLFNEMSAGGGVSGRVFLYRSGAEHPLDLGPGFALDLAPDGRQAVLYSDGGELILVPLGTGQVRKLATGLASIWVVRYLPGGDELLICGAAPGGGARFFRIALAGGPPRPVTPEGDWSSMALSPDGREVAVTALQTEKAAIYPLAGGLARPLKGVEPADEAIAWSGDGKAIYFLNRAESIGRLFRHEIATGQRELVRRFQPADLAGLINVGRVVASPDGRAYAYAFNRATHCELHLIEGLK